METTDLISTTPTVTQSTPQEGALANQGFGEEFTNFLTLLTAQVENQDPLSPLDSTQFVEQLATFSSLEQQVRSNNSLDAIATTLTDLQSLIASEWLGQTVSVETSFLPYQGDPIEFTFDAPASTDRAELTVRDREGAIVFSSRLDPAQASHVWNGQTASGEIVPNDTLLQFSVDFFSDEGQFIGSAPPRVVTTVNNVATENGKVRLGTDMKMSAGIDDVRRVSEEP